ncbi:aminotransferase class I/II-fold pyridoxal phosphate-dependent enzyme [bacterium 210820-DFI.6.37]|nr:aminotransferase class I/II-fold pyridoxal phosphate-dependent enzyme [bacterium 210820-DFI.6.37]
MTNYKFDTIKVRGGYDSSQHNRSVAVPIYATAAYDFDSPDHFNRIRAGAEAGFLYTRIGNPTVAVLEQRVAQLDGGSAALGLASGMAAVSYSLLAATGGKGRILSTKQIYGGTFDLERDVFPELGIHFDLVSHDSGIEEWENAVREDTKAIFIESISNPGAKLLDIEALAELAHRHGIPLLVDNTFATPYLLRPLDHGADIVIYSATKGLNGHGNAIGGVIVEGKPFHWSTEKHPQFYKRHWVSRDLQDEERSFLEAFPDFPFIAFVRTKLLAYLGAALSPYDAQLILIGLETLSERVSKQVASTRKLIQYLKTRTDAVAWIQYPEVEESPYKELADRYFPKGAGTAFSFGFKGTEKQTAALLDAVKLFGYQANVGDAKSLIVNPPKITHGELRPAELKDAGVLLETIRLSLGLEDADDLIDDLNQAFAAAGFEK